jgi:Na+-driven multidrug efflux pump
MSCSFSLRNLRPFPKETFKQMLKYGAPSAGEPISYQFSQMVIFTFINSLGTAVITTRMYAQMITYFTYLSSLAMAQAAQIIVGHLVGAEKYDEAYHLIMKSLKKAWVITLGVALLFAFLRVPIFSLFTKNQEIIALGGFILLIDIVLEMGRVVNLIVIGGLKASGDVNFPMITGILSMWGISTAGAYFFGLHLGWGLVGIWLAMLLDEVIRGILMIFRWQSGKWRDRLVIGKK